MKVTQRSFKPEDFEKVRDFLQETYNIKSSNWYIERWSWSRYVNGYWSNTFDEWPSTVGMWVDENDEIIAIVTTEGDINGDVFFQLKDTEYSEEFIHLLLDFAENNLSKVIDGKKVIYPRVNNICKDLMVKVLKNRGYSFTGNNESDSSMVIDGEYKINLPPGFRIESAFVYEPIKRGQAHGRAFNNELSEVPALLTERTRAYSGLVKSPDYKDFLDLCVIDENGVIAAFATFWFDSKNKIGSLEPLGTILKYRRMGLGKALVYEGLNRLSKLGVRKVHVGSNQIFYKNIGFDVESESEIWEKVLGYGKRDIK